MRDEPIIRHRDLRALLPLVPLVTLLVWAPWPFGSVTAWGAGLLVALAGVCLAAAVAAAPALDGLRAVAWPALALAALALLGLLQSLPWPAAVVGLVSPEHARLAEDAARVLGDASAGPGRWLPLSVAPTASRRGALLFAGVAAALAAAALAGRRRLGRRVLGAALLATALAQVLYGAPLWFARARSLWGVAIPGSERLRGTFVNPNHLAVYLEIALAATFAWGWWAAARARREPALERRIALVAGPALVWLTLFVALAFTGSRAGLAAAAGGLAVQGLLGAGRRRGALLPALVRASLVVALLAVGGAAVLWLGAEEGLGRWQASDPGHAFQARLDTYRDALELWRRFPWLGTGLGTFLHAFPQVQSTTPELTWWHAHSDPLELLVVAGVAGAALLLAGLAALVARLLRGLRGAARSEDAAAALAALGALVAVGLHETVDFGLTVAANAFTLAVVAGAAAGAATGSPRHRDGSARPPGSGPRGGADPP